MRHFTSHAEARAQQRGIPPFIVDVVVDNGHCKRRHGADVYFLDKQGRKKVKKILGTQIYRRLKDFLDAYVVISDDGQVITCGHHLKRLYG